MMSVRLTEDHVRVRIGPGEMDILARGEVAAISIAAPGADRRGRVFVCRLRAHDDQNGACAMSEEGLDVSLSRAQMGELGGDSHERVMFEVAGARTLAVSVEKDRHQFVRAGRQ